ncbi:MAG: hypothetical protein AAGA81_14110 [Acidobacteriota bacterium]
MAILEIPLRPNGRNFRQRTTLDGQQYVLRFRWSARVSRWHLELLDQAGELLRGPVKCSVAYPLLASTPGVEGIPPGELLFIDDRTPPQDPGLEELGREVRLWYREGAV